MKTYFTLLAILFSVLVVGQNSRVDTFSIQSQHLDEPRNLSIYLPADFSPEKTYPVLYCTDGQVVVKAYQKTLDSLIATHTVAPLVMVGVHSNEQKIPDSQYEVRNYEYLDYLTSEDKNLENRFEKHLQFFVDEVEASLVNQYDFRLGSRYFYGFSNGADFGVSLANQYPDLFCKYLIYSLTDTHEELDWDKKDYPFFIMKYGSEEIEPLVAHNKSFSAFLTAQGYQHIAEAYPGKHTQADWQKQFAKDLKLLMD